MTIDWRNAPFRHADFPPVDLDLSEDADGTIRLTPRQPFVPLDGNIARAFLDQAARKGAAPALAERGADIAA